MKLNETYQKHKEIILYLIFGVLTTAVGWITYFAILLPGKSILSLPVEDTSSGRYLALYSAAQLVQWIAAVLFAFFTNRKYVFEAADPNQGRGGTLRQLVAFSSGRVVTFFLDFAVTLFGARLLAFLLPASVALPLFGREWNLAEISAKVLAAVIVLVGNYLFSKFLVFKKK